jgi:flavodoxin
MKAIVVYASKGGGTQRAAAAFEDIEIQNVSKLSSHLGFWDFFIFLCPTCGDEELPLEMEDFFQSVILTDKLFTICEFGNYVGLDELEWGPRRIITSHLLKLGWKEAVDGVSIDSVPDVDWDALNHWKEKVHEFINSNSIPQAKADRARPCDNRRTRVAQNRLGNEPR